MEIFANLICELALLFNRKRDGIQIDGRALVLRPKATTQLKQDVTFSEPSSTAFVIYFTYLFKSVQFLAHIKHKWVR